MTGAKRIVALVKKIQDALQENPYSFLAPRTDKSVTPPHK